MKLTNTQIETYAISYQKEFADFKSYIPAKISFYISKNINLLTSAANEIAQAKTKIAQHYGTPTPDGTGYSVPPEKIPEATKELEDLYNIEQDLSIKTFSIEDLDGVEFTPAQMSAIIFMIEEE